MLRVALRLQAIRHNLNHNHNRHSLYSNSLNHKHRHRHRQQLHKWRHHKLLQLSQLNKKYQLMHLR